MKLKFPKGVGVLSAFFFPLASPAAAQCTLAFASYFESKGGNYFAIQNTCDRTIRVSWCVTTTKSECSLLPPHLEVKKGVIALVHRYPDQFKGESYVSHDWCFINSDNSCTKERDSSTIIEIPDE